MAATATTSARDVRCTQVATARPTNLSPSSDKKRKLDQSPEVMKLYPLFGSPPKSPFKSQQISRSPVSSPLTKKKSLTLKQGANQNNKIFRYLQPKRLLSSFDNQETSISTEVSTLSMPSRFDTQHDKENNFLDVKVSLIRVDDRAYCLLHQSPKRLCCNAASEFVVEALSEIIHEDYGDPCRRLGVPAPVCVSSVGCSHGEEASSDLHQDTLYNAMLEKDDLKIAMLRSAYNKLSKRNVPSPSFVHSVFKLMKESADKDTVNFGRSYLKRALDCFPPCTERIRNNYLHVLHSSEQIIKKPSGLWSLRSLEFFDENLNELEKHIDSLLNPSQLKEKQQIAGKRSKRKPLRFRESPSPLKQCSHRGSEETKEVELEEAYESILLNLENLQEEALKKKESIEMALKNMEPEEKTNHIFSRFGIIVDILERDLVIWLNRNNDHSIIRNRTSCPLVVLALWKPECDTCFDSVHCRRIFAMYSSAWVLKFAPHHLQILSRLIGLIAEVTSASEPNNAKLYPFVGDGCENLARKVGGVLKGTQLKETRTKAIAMLKPEWLKLLVSANVLEVSPSISSMDLPTLLGPPSDITLPLWVCFLEGLLGFYHIKDAMILLKQASKGLFKEELLAKNANPIKTINYKVLLREILAFYHLSCQVENPSIGDVPYLLKEMLTF